MHWHMETATSMHHTFSGKTETGLLAPLQNLVHMGRKSFTFSLSVNISANYFSIKILTDKSGEPLKIMDTHECGFGITTLYTITIFKKYIFKKSLLLLTKEPRHSFAVPIKGL